MKFKHYTSRHFVDNIVECTDLDKTIISKIETVISWIFKYFKINPKEAVELEKVLMYDVFANNAKQINFIYSKVGSNDVASLLELPKTNTIKKRCFVVLEGGLHDGHETHNVFLDKNEGIKEVICLVGKYNAERIDMNEEEGGVIYDLLTQDTSVANSSILSFSNDVDFVSLEQRWLYL